MIYSIISLPGRGQWKNLENPLLFPGDQTSQFSIPCLAKAKMIRQQRLEVFLEVHLQHQGTGRARKQIAMFFYRHRG